MNPLVRDLYKRFLYAGRDYPKGLDFIRTKAKEAFFANSHLVDDYEVKLAIAKGRWMVKEIIGVNKLHKYRSLRKRYSNPESN